MRRDDLSSEEPGKFDGWQAVDATPQEESGGICHAKFFCSYYFQFLSVKLKRKPKRSPNNKKLSEIIFDLYTE